jgi:hypothetical protein
LLLGTLGLLVSGAFSPAAALVKFDFEQKFYVHPQRQVWDFCLIRPDSTFHLFYHSIHEQTPSAVFGDTIWHAKSEDLMHWSEALPVLTVGPEWWDAEAMWAPDVVFDPVAQRWTMAYTGVDEQLVQRPCVAHSLDLVNWTKEVANPVVQPDSMRYFWSPEAAWSSFRDPFLYREAEQWHMLSTAALRVGGYPGFGIGILQRSTSSDLVNWVDTGFIFANNGSNPSNVLESSQYHIRNGWHHLFFGEFDIPGISHVAAHAFGDWDMAQREIIDDGGAPEIKQFDPGIDLLARFSPLNNPPQGTLSYVVRFDTLLWHDEGATPFVHQPHPLDADWAARTGTATYGAPTFGDNTAMRGDEPSGLVGNGWLGTKEYFQGPLSGRGSPGAMLGDGAQGTLLSHPFRIEGDYINLLVGGGYYPETCFVALLDAETDSVLFKATGFNSETMTGRSWDVRPYKERLVRIYIEDSEQGEFGHINVDEITEAYEPLVGVPPTEPVAILPAHGAWPNPFNPRTVIWYRLGRPGPVQVQIHDVQGRRIWAGPVRAQSAGEHQQPWPGLDQAGYAVPAGVYLYSILLAGHPVASGKLALVK